MFSILTFHSIHNFHFTIWYTSFTQHYIWTSISLQLQNWKWNKPKIREQYFGSSTPSTYSLRYVFNFNTNTNLDLIPCIEIFCSMWFAYCIIMILTLVVVLQRNTIKSTNVHLTYVLHFHIYLKISIFKIFTLFHFFLLIFVKNY